MTVKQIISIWSPKERAEAFELLKPKDTPVVDQSFEEAEYNHVLRTLNKRK